MRCAASHFILQNIYFIFGFCAGLFISIIMTVNVSDDECLGRSEDQLSSEPRFYYSENVDDDNTDFVPHIHLEGRIVQKGQQTPQVLIRPRYYSTELGIRNKLFVAVLSTNSTIEKLGIPLNKSLSHLVDKVMFFVEISDQRKFNFSMPGLIGFTDTRKHLKPFHVIKYISDNYLDEYDYFFLVSDATYVKGKELRNLASKISVAEDIHLGFKKDGSEYCSLDTGLLLSNFVIRKIMSNIDWCVKNSHSVSNDDNMGQCIVRSTNIPCSNTAQGQIFSSYMLSESFSSENDIKAIGDKQKFHSAITLYPVLKPEMFYYLTSYFGKVYLNESQKLIKDLRNLMTKLPSNSTEKPESSDWPIGNQGGHIAHTRFDVSRWNYFDEESHYLHTDFSNKEKLYGATKLDIQCTLNETIERSKSINGGRLKYKQLLNGYKKFDPTRGMDYILDTLFYDTVSLKNVNKRFQVCRPLGKPEVVPMPYVTENTRINMVLPVAVDDYEDVIKFIERYTNICMEKQDKTFLLLVFLYDSSYQDENSNDVFLNMKKMALSLSDQYKKSGSKIGWVSIKVPSISSFHINATLLLDIAIADMLIQKFPPESLVLMCQPNMGFTHDFLNRVRMNTVSQHQVFSPVPFMSYNPEIVYNPSISPNNLNFDVTKNTGHYDLFSSEIVSFFIKDYIATRKSIAVPVVRTDHDIDVLISAHEKGLFSLEESSEIPNVYKIFVTYGDLNILRAVDPGLKLQFKQRDCSQLRNKNVLLFTRCMESNEVNMGTRSHLAKTILEYETNQVKDTSYLFRETSNYR